MSPPDKSRLQGERPSTPRYSAELLRRIRNEIPLDRLIQDLNWPHKRREGRFAFLCPGCGEFLTAIKRETNLGRCFHCERNYNPIDFTIQICDHDFVQAVEFLRPRLPR
jgi:hypothetical protein